MFDLEKDDFGLIALFDNNKIYYTIVERDPEVQNTGISIIKRILQDRNKFIGDIYSVQSYFGIKYIDDTNIKTNEKLFGSDRNELTIEELDNFIDNEHYRYIYVYNVEKNSLLIKEPMLDVFELSFYDKSVVEDYISSRL
jgi:hypothetical protein